MVDIYVFLCPCKQCYVVGSAKRTTKPVSKLLTSAEVPESKLENKRSCICVVVYMCGRVVYMCGRVVYMCGRVVYMCSSLYVW